MTLISTKCDIQANAFTLAEEDQRRDFWTEAIPVVPLTALRKRVILVTCLLLLVAVGVNVQLLLSLSSAGMHVSADQGRDRARALQTDAPNHPALRDALESTRTTSFLLLLSTLTCLGCIGYVMARRTVSPPVATMTQTLGEIAAGNLSVTAPVMYSDEIGNLGKAVNEVAANYQEVLLFAGTVVGNSLPALDTIEEKLEQIAPESTGEQIRQQLEVIRGELDKLGSVIKDFQFYEVYFDGRQALPLPPIADKRCK